MCVLLASVVAGFAHAVRVPCMYINAGESQDQCVQGLLGSVVVSRPVRESR